MMIIISGIIYRDFYEKDTETFEVFTVEFLMLRYFLFLVLFAFLSYFILSKTFYSNAEILINAKSGINFSFIGGKQGD